MNGHTGALVGLAVGVVLGFALAFGGFFHFLVVLFVGAIGLVAGRVADGDLDLSRYLGSRGQRLDK